MPDAVIHPMGGPALQRFDVYRNTVAVGLVRALEDGFPVVRKLLGEPFFAAMALVHVREHPPRSPVLMLYGVDFPDFLEGFSPVAHLGYLADVARLELLLRESHHAADAEPLPADVLGALTPDALLRARIVLAPSVRLMRSAWPVQSIWAATARGGPSPMMQPEDVAVLRAVFDPHPHLLGPGAAVVMAALLDGRPLGDALDAAPEVDAQAFLGLLLRERAITRIET